MGNRRGSPKTAARPSDLVEQSLESDAARVEARPRAPLTITRPELLANGSDRNFRRLVHGLFGLLARHEAIRAGHGAVIGLAGIEYTVLISIGHLVVEEQTVSINRVADHLHLSGAFVTTVSNKLMRMGLIHKRQDPEDRRRVRLDVSDTGRALLAKLAPTQRQVNDVQFECLDRDEFLRLINIVERLIESSDRALQLQNYLASRRGDHPLSVDPVDVAAA